MTTEIDRSLTRLEASAKIKELARNIQIANGALLAYACTLTGNDDHTIDESMTLAIKVGSKISRNAHLLQGIAIDLEHADKDEARKRKEDAFMDKIMRSRIGGEE